MQADWRLTATIVADYEAMSRRAAARVLARLRAKADLLLCAATGASPLRLYELLGQEYRSNSSMFSKIRVLKLDEWGGLAMDDGGTSEVFLRRHLLQPLGISDDRYVGFESNPRDPAAECQRIESWLAANGPIDIAVLGLGLNEHLALNEPAQFLRPSAHVAQLTEGTLRHPMLVHAKAPPRFGLTLGMANLLAAREVLLLVSGSAKRDVLARLLHQEITPAFPASFLWLHPAVTLICDAEAMPGK